MIGKTLSHFKITAKLGEGGMGAVYHAEDTKLGREVAIKVLPDVVSHDPERLARFEREARVLASLNHPHIAGIHQVEEDGGVHFLVMELAEGEDLAERLARGAIRVDEALPIALQIAAALEAAHDKGIIHRDLKPANVKVSSTGQVKVLDFGLAKALDPETGTGSGILSPDSASMSPTLTARMTDPGVILGTAAYMAPEQTRGHDVDRRADIWAFGCVLLESLTGKLPFRADTVSDSIGAILHVEPDWEDLPELPASVRKLLERCLKKNPKDRLQHIGDARIELSDALSGEEVAVAQPGEQARSSRWRLAIPWGLVALSALALLLVMPKLRKAPSPESTVRRMLIETGPLDLTGWSPAIALSRDGRRLAYVRRDDDGSELLVRELDSFEGKQVPGTRGAQGPFFSPDGERLGFTWEGELRTVAVEGGPVTTLFRGWVMWGASWGLQNRIVFAEWPTRRLMDVSASGDEVQRLTEHDYSIDKIHHAQPEFAGNNGAIVFNNFNAFTAVGVPGLMARNPDGEAKELLAQGGTKPLYVSTGHLIFVQAGSLMAAPFDVESLTLTAAAVPVLEGVVTTGNRTAHYAIADDGTLAYVAGEHRTMEHLLVRVDRQGESRPVSNDRRSYWGPRFSPDGGRLAFWLSGNDPQVWIHDLARDSLTRLTSARKNFWPLWTPDGIKIAFPSRHDDGGLHLYWKSSDGSTPSEQLTQSKLGQQPGAWSPDGRWLVFQEGYDFNTKFDIWVFDLEEQVARPLLETEASEFQPSLSADGEWLAYVSDESGRREVYVARFPDLTNRTAISANGGSEPVWNPHGSELFFRANGQMMVADFFEGSELKPGKARILFEDRFVPGTPYGRNYDVSPDGASFVMVSSAEKETAPSEVHVVLNWFQELERLVPTH